MMQQTYLSSIKENLEYEVLAKEIEQNKVKREDLNDLQRQMMDQIEERNAERKREEEFQREQE